tara:strand:+ start:603 stop:725 length:123 start_codon:yes stop_codon:yes gene_type:complete
MSEDINMDEMWNEYHENVLRQWGGSISVLQIYAPPRFSDV